MKHLRVVTEENGRYPMGLTVTRKRLHVSVEWAGKTCSLVLFEKGENIRFNGNVGGSACRLCRCYAGTDR